MQIFNTKEEWKNILNHSEEQSVVILKHSNICPISARGYAEVQKFEEENHATVYLLIVQNASELKIQIADETGVAHESPQVLILKEGKVVYSANHSGIVRKELATAYNKALQ